VTSRTPNDFSNTKVLDQELTAYFADINENPKPIQWTYTKSENSREVCADLTLKGFTVLGT
jgi:hypothetical protein